MHELSLAQSLLDIVCREAARLSAAVRVNAVNMKVGRFTALDRDALSFWFGLLAKEQLGTAPDLVIEEVDLVVKCPGCGAQERLEDPPIVCPRCGNGAVEIVSGRELDVWSIEVDEPTPTAG
ncbi:MAG: hydrogenase maturation nickel metallochaperone HypA [Candidatus Riflebacteria bacterium]|nr:hydrogenase maturation nickel metallochaperone HypA [Candidatus Riflebacteria bacterium]